MASRELQEIIRRADALSLDEQLLLIAHLAEKARQEHQAPDPRPAWSEIQGIAPYPLAGEDAQAWVTRTRRESEASRERGLDHAL